MRKIATSIGKTNVYEATNGTFYVTANRKTERFSTIILAAAYAERVEINRLARQRGDI